MLPKSDRKRVFDEAYAGPFGDIYMMQKFMVNLPNTTGGLGCEGTSSAGAVLAWFVHPEGR